MLEFKRSLVWREDGVAGLMVDMTVSSSHKKVHNINTGVFMS